MLAHRTYISILALVAGACNPVIDPDSDHAVCNPPDLLEPHDSERDALVLMSITDDDNEEGLVKSILGGAGDVDWFTFTGSDFFGAYVLPTGDLEADMSLRLCIYVECMGTSTDAFTCHGSVDDVSPELRRGCCVTGPDAAVAIDLYCGGDGPLGSEDAQVYLRVDQGYTDLCVHYDLAYHY